MPGPEPSLTVALDFAFARLLPLFARGIAGVALRLLFRLKRFFAREFLEPESLLQFRFQAKLLLARRLFGGFANRFLGLTDLALALAVGLARLACFADRPPLRLVQP